MEWLATQTEYDCDWSVEGWSCKWCENDRLVKYSELKRQPWVFVKNKQNKQNILSTFPIKIKIMKTILAIGKKFARFIRQDTAKYIITFTDRVYYGSDNFKNNDVSTSV